MPGGRSTAWTRSSTGSCSSRRCGELLPASGIEATTSEHRHLGQLLFAMFLLGWGLSMVWGIIGDRIGRVRALALTIVALLAVHAAVRPRHQHLAADVPARPLRLRPRRRAAGRVDVRRRSRCLKIAA